MIYKGGSCRRDVKSVMMLLALVPILFAVAAAYHQNDPSANQLADFKKKTMAPIGILTTAAGAPVEYNDAWNSLNTDLISNEYLIDDMMSVVRERIPERVVHGAGTGGFGYFETTHDISHICKANLFSEVGKKTPVAVRISLGFSRSAAVDTVRETRGFACKFYTEEGNFDLTALNAPIFAFRDPVLFGALTHSARRSPANNLPDLNMLWDYLTQNPESIFIFMFLFSDYGTPLSYRHMPSFPIHTYQVHNEDGERSFIRFHILPCLGIKNFNATGSRHIAKGDDPDYYARDLYNSIGNCENPSWYVKVQIVSEKDMRKSKTDIFDITRTLPLDIYPLHPVGKIILNKNPINYFAEIEQLAFCPGNLVPGIDGAPDKVFESRRLLYRDAQHYRLGSNFRKIPVNCPLQSKVLNYIRDGVPPVGDNGRDGPNYFPNSFNGPIPYTDTKRPRLLKIHEKLSSNFDQARHFYVKELDTDQKRTLVDNIVNQIKSCEKMIKKRAIKLFTDIDSELGQRVSKRLAAI